jgi:hypothetical protein
VVLQRAEAQLNSALYSLIFNNCEHFATYCATGRASCRQLRRRLAGLTSELQDCKTDLLFSGSGHGFLCRELQVVQTEPGVLHAGPTSDRGDGVFLHKSPSPFASLILELLEVATSHITALSKYIDTEGARRGKQVAAAMHLFCLLVANRSSAL